MFRINVETTGPQVGVVLQRQWKAMNAALARVILKAATIAGGFITKEVQARVKWGTGNLEASFLPATFVQSSRGRSGVAAGALSDLNYARIQDEGSGYLPGGVIKPKPPLKNLAIPVTTAAKAIWPREWSPDALEWRPSNKGGSVLIEKATGTLQYILKPEVKIPAKHYLQAAAKSVRKDMPPKVANALAKAMKAAAGRSGT